VIETSFSDRSEMLVFAERLLTDRMKSLDNDIRRCIEFENKEFTRHSQPAPFPALCYCFATIDMLGALYAGNATRHRDSTSQSRNYMTDFMKYPYDIADLLQDLFRHRLVHLAQPHPILTKNGKRIAWRVDMPTNRENHLKLEDLEPESPSRKFILTSNLTLVWDQEFRLSIRDFCDDIMKSVENTDSGYRQSLRVKNELQINFEKAVRSIYS
jgi:hypothetical protein